MSTVEETFRNYKTVPPITDERLAELAERIKPVILRGGELFYIEDVDLRGVAFTWDPKVTTKAEGLVRIGSIPTIHTCGYYGFFKPSVAEVLAGIDLDADASKVVAFETLTENLTLANVLKDGGHQVTTTLLYGKAS